MARVAVVGCGVVGSSWALVFARAGFEIRLWDASPAAAGEASTFVSEALGRDRLESPGATMRVCASLEEALEGVEYVQESAPERLEIKRELYCRLDTIAAPEVVLASSTSGLPASSFTDHLANRARCLVVHPINPPHLIPLVELVPAPWTRADIVERAAELMARGGQTPIRLSREFNGFVVNRLQGALLGEAFRLVEDGICDVADIDRAVSDGLGLRWFFMGPFETIDLNAQHGVAEYCRNLGPMYHGLAREQADPREWGPALVAEVERQCRRITAAEDLPARRAWRDGCLAALAEARQRVLDAQATTG
ncbi:3-hydroxyacyl-CoA dehydrogenase [Burkholderia gladioli]|uniref:3-hydroxyacyl-CoA dehydrogenase n=1 Tax=Burkholderia gladioli TaxID=28095 RepID=UPI0013649A8D|nr:3-hydroxyacyl-CoA dehydrogenase [Burkholderia gladioli]KAF1058390.1 L-carnitine dehydrogenase [Burkholderia gladioli]MBJ9675681.1 3-hydroxyacyl-CoA dehydrogenase [Burkholderia gladioli]MDN7461337.1 3-hydroxyacyl-CoA dehydrogenase [Burkholderia gladioli]NRF82452.1 3-hydroxyacyl-CoA dehydrogenase [Burkholderia gladioli]WAG22581.1 3-hydroxyacyl-CoA dehydrogenase [Burkholderia gladioli]